MSTQKDLRNIISKLDDDFEKCQRDVKAREQLLSSVMKELGSLAPLQNRRYNYAEILCARPRWHLNLPTPPILVNEDWRLIMDGMLFVAFSIDNQSDYNGLVYMYGIKNAIQF